MTANPVQMTRPAIARTAEDGRSVKNCPRNVEASMRFAKSGTFSITMARRRGVNRIIVFTASD